MAWKEMTIKELALSLKINPSEAREKQRLMLLIAKARKKEGLSQAKLAKIMGVSQSRVAQIESGVGTARMSYDVLLSTLSALGYDFKLTIRKSA